MPVVTGELIPKFGSDGNRENEKIPVRFHYFVYLHESCVFTKDYRAGVAEAGLF